MNYGDKIKFNLRAGILEGTFIRWICNELVEVLVEGNLYNIKFDNILDVKVN